MARRTMGTTSTILLDDLSSSTIPMAPRDTPPEPINFNNNNSHNKSKNEVGWRKIVRNFTPSWFSICMGTGISSILLHNFPFPNLFTTYTSYVLFALNVLLFTVFTLISLARYSLYPAIWNAMIAHPAQSLFLGCYPMGLATLVNMVVFVFCQGGEGGWWKVAWTLWWIDAAISMACCLYVPFVIMSIHSNTLPTMTAAWLLPIVSTIVASASGGIVAEILPNPQHALITVISSYVLWGTGVPLALTVLVIYFQRLTLHALPPREVIVSVFLPLGPLGQGGFAIQQLGKVAMTIFPLTNTLPLLSSSITTNSSISSGEILYITGWLLATIMWGFALVWLTLALLSITQTKSYPFNMGWWGFTFPLGVFTTSTTQMGKELPSKFFSGLGAGMSLCVVILWAVVGFGTVKRAWTGEMFVAPCLKGLEEKEEGESGGDVA